MKAFVTGAKGQLGSDLVPALIAAGLDVTGFGSELDITDAKALGKAVNSEKPELIVNCAAYTKVDLAEKESGRAFAVNRDGAANVAKAAKETGAKLIHVSTDFVFDGKKTTPYAEDDETSPLGVYGMSKLEGERAVMEILPGSIIVRTSWLYGKAGANFVKTIIRLAGERETLKIVFDQAGSPTWSKDLANTIAKMARHGNASGIFHYSNEGVASWYDFAVSIIEEAAKLNIGLKCREVEPILTCEYPTPAKRPAYSVLDKKKIKETFNIRIPHWRSSLHRMMAEAF